MGDLVLRDEDDFFKLSFLKRFLLGTNGIIAGGCSYKTNDGRVQTDY
jgi:hypothetical protein